MALTEEASSFGDGFEFYVSRTSTSRIHSQEITGICSDFRTLITCSLFFVAAYFNFFNVYLLFFFLKKCGFNNHKNLFKF